LEQYLFNSKYSKCSNIWINSSHVTTYPPWFFLFVYKIADFTSDVILFLLIGVIIPLVYLLLVPFLDKSEYLHPMNRKIFVGFGILMITYLIQTTIWGDLAPGIPVSITKQVTVYLPPAIIVALGLAIIRMKPNGGGIAKAQLSPISAIIFTVVALLMAGAFVGFADYPSITTLGILIPLALVFLIGARSLTPRVFKADQTASTVTSSSPETSLERKKKIAQVILVVLLIFSVILAATIWTIPPTGYQSNMFGVDLGLIFIMWGEAISLYHYIIYKKPNESYE